MLLQTAVTRFRAMGTDCEVHVTAAGDAADELAVLGATRVELLEQSWSRFRSTSELSRLNARAGLGAVPVSDDLLLLVQRMQQAWLGTEGLVDPTVLASMTALGYDADLTAVAARPASHWQDAVTAPAPGMAGVRVDAAASTVALPSGIGLDPGAIGKGLAADIVAAELVGTGADRVLVNLGGDIAVAGGGEAWHIGVEDARSEASPVARILTVSAPRAGIATSTTMKRRWAQGRRHHVIDPRTGGLALGDIRQVTVVAGSASEAEVLATAALLLGAGDAAGWLAGRATTALIMTDEDVLVVHEGEPA